MKNKFLLMLWLTSLLAAAGARAEDDDGGAEYQYQGAAGLDGAFGKRLGWGLTQSVYLDENFRMYSYSSQASLAWSATKWLSLSAGYRVASIDEVDTVWIRQRLLISGAFSLPVDDWHLSYRLRWQGDWRDPDEGGRRYRSYLRNRFQAQYAGFDRVKPYGSVEVVHRLDDGRTTSGVDRVGYRVGSELEMTPHQSIDLWGRLTVYTNDNPDLYTFGLEYSYSFK